MAVTPKKKSKIEKIEKVLFRYNSINIYAKLQVSRFNGVARIEVRYKQTRKNIYIYIYIYTYYESI